MSSFLSSVNRSSWYPFVRWQASCHVALGRPPTGSSELRLSSIRQRLLAFAPMVIVSRHGAQLAFVGVSFRRWARGTFAGRHHALIRRIVALCFPDRAVSGLPRRNGSIGNARSARMDGARAIELLACHVIADRRDLEAPALPVVQDRGKDAWAVETWHAEPID